MTEHKVGVASYRTKGRWGVENEVNRGYVVCDGPWRDKNLIPDKVPEMGCKLVLLVTKATKSHFHSMYAIYTIDGEKFCASDKVPYYSLQLWSSTNVERKVHHRGTFLVEDSLREVI